MGLSSLAYVNQVGEAPNSTMLNSCSLNHTISRDPVFEQLVGTSRTLRKVIEQVQIVAPGNATVLLLGETGTGKELIARAMHNRSPRKERPFVKLNCAAIPYGLLESELFGHERGAFTGAISQKIGRLELADRGSLFLDEIGDIPLELQPKLLRALQEREFERLGSTRTKKVDVRVVAATHRNLEEWSSRNNSAATSITASMFFPSLFRLCESVRKTYPCSCDILLIVPRSE